MPEQYALFTPAPEPPSHSHSLIHRPFTNMFLNHEIRSTQLNANLEATHICSSIYAYMGYVLPRVSVHVRL